MSLPELTAGACETQFREFPKMPRLIRECIVTEKIDGTNASIYIGHDGEFLVGSRTRWITPENDNFGFATWAHQHKDELLALGPGHHFGEWWGVGIQRGYKMSERRFSLFNVSRWHLAGQEAKVWKRNHTDGETMQEPLPNCCSLVPVLGTGLFSTEYIDFLVSSLVTGGSKAAPGYMKPEGVVAWHAAANIGFKKTIESDEMPKGLVGQ